jgi:WD40 repeat protein
MSEASITVDWKFRRRLAPSRNRTLVRRSNPAFTTAVPKSSSLRMVRKYSSLSPIPVVHRKPGSSRTRTRTARVKAVQVFAPLTASIRSFDWLPDGRRAILGLSNTFYDGHLWIADFTRETMRQITTGTGTEVEGVVSPDGERIAYAMSDIDFDLVGIPLDGSPIRRAVATGRREHSVAWSPSAAQFAYVTDRDGPFEIWLKSDRDGWERPVVKPADFPDGDVKALITGLAFSPDGKRIAYTRLSLDKYVIWISPVTGGPAMRLREEQDGEFSPIWSHDGNSILYLRVQGAGIGAVKVQVGKGDSLERLTKGAWAKMKNVHLKWSPTGDWIAIDTEDGLTLVTLDSDASRVLNSQRYAEVEWSRDSKTIFGLRKEERETLICSVDVGTGKEIVISRIGPDWNLSDPIDTGLNVSVSYDGKSLWTTARRDHFEVWLLDGWKGK